MAKCVKAKRMRRMQQKGVIVHANKVYEVSVRGPVRETEREGGNKLAEQHAIY